MTAALIEQLTAIREEHGSLTPALLVGLAVDPEHPLHSQFEWDDTVAGHKYRIEQAGRLLRVTYKPMPGQTTELRAFHVRRNEETETSEYVPTEEIVADPLALEILLRSMKRDWKIFERRYHTLEGFAEYVAHQLNQEAS